MQAKDAALAAEEAELAAAQAALDASTAEARQEVERLDEGVSHVKVRPPAPRRP